MRKETHFMRKMPDPALRKTDAFAPFKVTADTITRPNEAGFAPRYRVTASVHAALDAIARSDQDLARFEADAGTAHAILRDALTRNAFGTASIEGNPMTLPEVESLLARAPTPDTVTVPDEREILNYADLVRDLDAVPVPRDGADVARLHARLFKGVIADAGAFKDKPNFVGRRETREVVFVPTPPDRVVPELDAALQWWLDADEHPVVKAMVFFHEFQSIHPFPDGNGRLGRALTTLQLHHSGYHGVRYALVDYAFNADRDAYYGAIAAAQRAGWDLTSWLDYMAGVLERTFRAAVQRFLFHGALPEGLNDRQVRVAEWFGRVTHDNAKRRVKFNDVHAAFPAVPRRTLQFDLARLVDAGVIDRQGEKRGTHYGFAG